MDGPVNARAFVAALVQLLNYGLDLLGLIAMCDGQRIRRIYDK